jgi:hypothetical protein
MLITGGTGIVKLLISLFTVSVFFIQTAQAGSKPIINCQIQGYEAATQIAPDYLRKFQAKSRIKVGNWESCYKRATLFSKKYDHEVSNLGVHRVYHNGVPHTVVGKLKKVRVFKWIYKVSKGKYISGIISKYTDSHVLFPSEGSHLFDQGGVLLDIDPRLIEKN